MYVLGSFCRSRLVRMRVREGQTNFTAQGKERQIIDGVACYYLDELADVKAAEARYM